MSDTLTDAEDRARGKAAYDAWIAANPPPETAATKAAAALAKECAALRAISAKEQAAKEKADAARQAEVGAARAKLADDKAVAAEQRQIAELRSAYVGTDASFQRDLPDLLKSWRIAETTRQIAERRAAHAEMVRRWA